MPTQTNNPTGLEKRREQNRLAQQRFRQKHRQRKDAEQGGPTPPSTTSDADQEPQPEDTLTRFLSEPDLSATGWSMNSAVENNFNDMLNLELDVDQTANHFGSSEGLLISPDGEDMEFLNIPERLSDSSWQSPLHIAVNKGHTKIIRMLLKHKADCNERDSEGFTPLMLAITRGYDDVVDLLLSNGAGIQHVNNQDQSALHLAVLRGCDRLLEKLLQHCKGDSAVINGYAKDGKIPLHIAIDMGFEAAVELLLEYGADVRHKARTIEA